MSTFDPYQAWLDIPTDQRPATHYRLLGVREFESDRQIIAAAGDRVLAHLAKYQQGHYAADCSQLMQEVQQAKGTLLDPVQKSQYDTALRLGQPTGSVPTAGGGAQVGSSFPPARLGQEQQIGSAPPVPGTSSAARAASPERQIGGAPPVPGAVPTARGQERKLSPPSAVGQIGGAPPVPGGNPASGGMASGGERSLSPPSGIPGSGPGAASNMYPPGQQMAAPGPPGPPGPPGSARSMPVGPRSNEQPLSGPGMPQPGGPGSRPVPRGVASPAATGSVPQVPTGPVPANAPGPIPGGYQGAPSYMPPGPGGPPQSGPMMGASPERPIQPGGVPFPQPGPGMQVPGQVPIMPGQVPGQVMPGQVMPGQMPQPYPNMPAQPGPGYMQQPPMPGGPGMPVPPGAAAGPPVQAHTPQQGGGANWVPEERTGRVGKSVAAAVSGQKGPSERTSYAAREARKPRRNSSSVYQILVIVFAGAIVLFGFILALVIARFVL